MTLPRTIEAALVIGRRDFTATVVSRTFLFFLLGPLFPILFGGLFGSIGANVAGQADRVAVAVVATAADYERLKAPYWRIRTAANGGQQVALRRVQPTGNTEAQVRALLADEAQPVTAVLFDPFGGARLRGDIDPNGWIAAQVHLLVGAANAQPAAFAVELVKREVAGQSRARQLTAHAGQALLFLLTLLLAGMLLSQLIEEKSNKAIEVLAAAAPVDAIFLGKLFAMLCVSLVGILVWGSCAAAALLFFSGGNLSGLPVPALGWPGFLLMALAYFCFGYLLIGGVFLGIGAQASTVREVQTMSMPITMSQLLIFAFAATAAAAPDSPAGLTAAVFPLSSPYAMLARAALDGRWWPHLLAIGWQALWLWLILRVAARVFRRSVLKSGPRRRWLGLGRPRTA
jgi:ABC-2 type transport system permease protein